jgi:hypothetical protein
MDAERAPVTQARIWPVVLPIFVLGMAVRALLLSLLPPAQVPNGIVEPFNIALSLLHNGTFAGAFSFSDTGPSGPTAHCMPLFPFLIALVIRVFGYGPAGIRALSWMGAAAASLGYALLPVLGRSCSMNRWVGISAGLFGALVPINFEGQMNGFFEAPFTLLALVCLASIAAKHWVNSEFTIKNGIFCGLAAAVTTYFSANTILILGLWFVCAFLWFSGRRKAVAVYFGVACLVVLVALAPWAIRNRLVLGSWVLTRSNFGHELQVSNNSETTSRIEFNEHSPGWLAQHPASNREERLKLLSMGEVAYSKAKEKLAIQWIRSNPKRFMELTLGRIQQFWFPQMHRLPQTIAMDMITILAMAGIVRLWKRSREVALLLGSASLAYSSIYIIIEVAMRYRFPVEGFLLILGAYAVYSWVADRNARRIATA